MRLKDLGRGLMDRLSGNDRRELPAHDQPPGPRHASPSHPGLENLAKEAEMADPIGTTLQPTAPPQQVQHFAIVGQDIRREAKDEPGFEVDQLVTGTRDADSLVGATNPTDDDLVLPGEGESQW